VFTLLWLNNPAILKGFDTPIIGFGLGVAFFTIVSRGVTLFTDIVFAFIPERWVKRLNRFWRREV